jgi:hypothetical protein
MKNLVILLAFMVLCVGASFAQPRNQKGVKKEQSRKVTKISKKRKDANKMIGPQISTSLVDNSTHAGKAKEYASAPLKITDATVNMLNQRAKGMGFPISGSGILGMPKVTYGIAKGKLLLRTTDAPTIGSSTGPGSVGTGTSIGTMGTSGNGLGVNGKNPYAGPNIYGTRPYGTYLSAPTGRTTVTSINRND